jgi:hypothetical protein
MSDEHDDHGGHGNHIVVAVVVAILFTLIFGWIFSLTTSGWTAPVAWATLVLGAWSIFSLVVD